MFNAASLAKQFSAAAIVLLAQQGKLSLDDDVRQHVPELPDYGARLTLRHLLHHTSGLRDQWELLWLAGGRDDDPAEEEDLLAVITKQRALNFRPGTEHLYSNTNYTLLALIVRRVSGMPLKDFAAQRLFAPAGMTSTFFRDSRFAVVKDGATGYRMVRGGRWGHTPYIHDVYGSGGLFTTAEDLLRWFAFLGQSNEVSRSLAREALAWGRRTGGDSIPYGAGMELGRTRGLRFAGHGGNDMGASAYAMMFLDRPFSIAVLCNGRELDAFGYARQIAALFLPPVTSAQAAAPGSQPAPIAVDRRTLERYAGIYFNPANMTTRRVELREGRLVWARSDSPLDAVATNRFRFPLGQPAELLFPVLASDTASQEMHLLTGGTRTVYRKAPAFAAAPGGLREYAGEFTSDEVNVTLTVVARDSGLVVSTPGSWSFSAEPVFRDAFALPETILLRFTRDARGRVTGMVADLSRSRNLRFQRVQ